tara:strand:+ start:3456 stop:3770 length:315 start_codon:yes stop_codon:yes gene_type:complete
MDATFHAFLHDKAEGHTKIATTLNARGLGLMDASLNFRSPLSEGSRIEYLIEQIDWSDRYFDVSYRGVCGDRLILEGRERRGLFVEIGGQLKAGKVAPLREILE